MANKKEMIEEGTLLDEQTKVTLSINMTIEEENPVIFKCVGNIRQERLPVNSDKWVYREYSLNVTHRNDSVASSKVISTLFGLVSTRDKDWKPLEV